MSFVHLHVHSVYSLLDGYSKLDKLMARAREMEMPAIALTDHGTMFGVVEFYNAARKAGIKPIIGVEGYLAGRTIQDRDPNLDKKPYHLLMLAENETGYKNLLKLSSLAQLEGFYYRPRVDRTLLAAHAEGIICSTGCMAADVPQAILNGNLEEARRRLDWYFDVFGRDRFYIELQSHPIPEMPEMNKALIELGKRYQANFIATNDVHYVDPGDARLQDILLAIQTGCVLEDPKRMRMSGQDYYLRSPQEMTDLFGHVPGAISNTLAIAERCNVDLGFKGYHLPKFAVPEGETPASYLRGLCVAGLQRRYGEAASSSQVQERLEYELGVIREMGFDAYFLIVWDLCQYAAKNKIWYGARGSAAGSIVAYALEITHVNPLEHGLIFERFLNPGRISMPDIDLDFPDDRRAQLMGYCADKYGHDKVAQIITFGTLKARAAVRDVGRVMGIPLEDVDRVAKMIPNIPGKPVTIEEALDTVPEFNQVYKTDARMHELLDTAKNMEGVIRNAGTHAAGVVITDEPIVNYLPLHRPTSQGTEDLPIKSVTQFEMSIIEELGLLKVDFLGLVTLSIMARACELIKDRHGKEFTLHNIPANDPASFELMGRGDTAGVFQVEGSGMRRYLMQMKPQNLDNVVAMIALFRPGPLEFIPTYIKRMHGEEPVEYHHPSLEPIFKETFGIPVYQEQIMRAAVELAGYKVSESDGLRKAIAKKMQDKLLAHREKFVKGAAANSGIPETIGNLIFDNWEEFARYGFNKSHAVVYGVIAAQTAFLKAYYPVEYMTALLTATSGDTEKIAQYIADCHRLGVKVLPPDVNKSGHEFTIEDGPEGSAIRFGMTAVKNVGTSPIEAIEAARKNGLFPDLNDFITRVDLRLVGKRALECLVKVGALDCYGHRAAILQVLDRMIAISTSHFKAIEAGQMSLFGASSTLVDKIRLPLTTEIPRREMLDWEKELMGLYVSDHPLSPYMEQLSHAVTHYAGELHDARDGEKVRVAGMVNRIRKITTKSNKLMAFATIEDMQGNIELVIFPASWQKFGNLVEEGKVILVEGNVDADDSEPKVLVDRIMTEFRYLTPLDETTVPQPAEKTPGQAPVQPSTAPKQVPVNRTAPPAPAQPVRVVPPTARPVPPKPTINAPTSPAPAIQPVVQPSRLARDIGGLDMPPPPDDFPDDWDQLYNPGEETEEIYLDERVFAERTVPQAPTIARSAEKTPAVIREPGPGESVQAFAGAGPVETPQPAVAPPPLPPDPPVVPLRVVPPLPAYLVSPRSDQEEPRGEGEAPRMLTVTLRANGDKMRDTLKIQRIHGILITYPGHDRFALYLFENNRSYLVEYPNSTTGISDELLTRLYEVVGRENVNIETIIVQ